MVRSVVRTFDWAFQDPFHSYVTSFHALPPCFSPPALHLNWEAVLVDIEYSVTTTILIQHFVQELFLLCSISDPVIGVKQWEFILRHLWFGSDHHLCHAPFRREHTIPESAQRDLYQEVIPTLPLIPLCACIIKSQWICLSAIS
jgi:hypothetical protein